MAKKETKSSAKSKKKPEFSKDTYHYWYESMELYRKFEERSLQLYGRRKIRGFLHVYIGQEAVIAGTMSAITKDDKLITAYRDHAHALAVGLTPEEVMAELYGKKTGCSKGKGGSMHMFSKEGNLFGGHGIVGGHIPLGAGIALAEKYNGTSNVCFTYMGDGAIRQGVFHETLNMAMTWKLPVVFIIENNQYAMGTAVNKISNVTELSQLGCAYDMPSFQVDGMSCEAVHHAIDDAAKRAREEQTPTLLEMKTYRYKGHSVSDPANYRTREELDKYKKNDPIERVKKTMIDNKMATENELKKIAKKVDDKVKEAIEFAENSEFPDPEEMYNDVYKEQDYPFLKDY